MDVWDGHPRLYRTASPSRATLDSSNQNPATDSPFADARRWRMRGVLRDALGAGLRAPEGSPPLAGPKVSQRQVRRFVSTDCSHLLGSAARVPPDEPVWGEARSSLGSARRPCTG